MEHVSSAKYLGITINSTLDLGPTYQQYMTAKANNTIGFPRRNINIASTKTKETAYFAMVRPSVDMPPVYGIHTRREI